MDCSFIPPFLLRHVEAATGTGDSGRRTLLLDQELRRRRDVAPEQPRQALATAGSSERLVHHADQREELPGRLVRDEGAPATGDAAVDEAYDSAGAVLELFASAFQRQSTDGNGAALSITVHFGVDYDNAFWDGTQLVFGDGDGEVFERFTKPMDVMAHEFTHAVTQFTAGLVYQGQSGALNESVSDVFAAMTKQRALGQTAADADWLIGEGIFKPGVAARALRSMIEPGTAYDDPRLGKDPQGSSMAEYDDTTQDNGGVHINSGIPNRAFALAAIALGGSSWEQAGRIWYDTLTAGEVTARSQFVEFAEATVASAGRLFADDSTVADRVREAWQTVGVLGAEAPVPEPEVTPAPVDAAGPRTVAVSRSGGVTGMTRTRELDLDQDPAGEQVRMLLNRAELQNLNVGGSGADRYQYTVMHGSWEVTVPEQELTPELDQIVRIVFERGSGPLG